MFGDTSEQAFRHALKILYPFVSGRNPPVCYFCCMHIQSNLSDQWLPTLRFMLESYTPVEEQAWLALLARLEEVSYDKGELLERFQSSVTYLNFVVTGFTRHYFLDPNGEEQVIWISEPGGLATDYAAFTLGKPTAYQIQAITPVVCLRITHEALEELYDQYKSWERIGRLINQHYLNSFIDKNNLLLVYPAAERYAYLMNQHPEWFNQIPLKYLASYLGMTTETLSRLRGANKKN